MISKTHSCAECGSAPVNHFAHKIDSILECSVIPLLLPTERLKRALISPLYTILEPFLPGLFLFCARIGFGKILRTPDAQISFRARCFWEEAIARGIEMKEFRPFSSFSSEIFFSRFADKVRVFQNLPRPKSSKDSALFLMDDKEWMRKSFQAASFPVAKGNAVSSEKEAEKLFSTLSKPLIVKPRSGSRSRHTKIHIESEAAFRSAFQSAKQLCPWVMVQEELTGSVYRATVIGGKLIGVVRRDPACVYGDGKSTVTELVKKENENPLRREPIFHSLPSGEGAAAELARQTLTWVSVPENGKLVTLGLKTSRGSGGSLADVTDTTHVDNKILFESIGKFLKDPLVGIDFIIPDISQSWRTQRCGVIECNSLPFLDLHHYVLQGTPRNAAGALWDIIFPTSVSRA